MKNERLGDYIEITNGFAFKSSEYSDNGARVIRITNVQKGEIKDNDPKFYPLKKTDNLNKYRIYENDILMSLTGNVGRVGRFPSELLPAYINQRICRVKSISKGLFDDYLYHILNSDKFEIEAIKASNGMAQLNLSTKWIEDFQIPLPPLPEQKRIAEILDKADTLRQKNKQLLAAYDELLQATFLDMFGDPVTNPKGWEKRPFNKCGHFTSGGTPDKSIKRYWDGKFPWVSPKDMKVSIIYDSLDHISESVFTETNLKRIPPNHLLIVVRGMILAHSFPLAINAVEVAINQDMKAIRPINNLNILYFQACLNSLKREVISLMSTAGHGTKKFDKESMERLYVPIPPITLQNQFSQIVENIEAQKTLVKQSLQESEDLFNGLVQKAFSGEL